MTTIYAKLIGGLAVVAIIIGGFLYINRLKSTIEFQKAALVSAKSIIDDQKMTIVALTEEKKEFEYRLVEAQKAEADIRDATLKRLGRVPAVPADCKPQVQWLKKRALDLKQDKK